MTKWRSVSWQPNVALAEAFMAWYRRQYPHAQLRTAACGESGRAGIIVEATGPRIRKGDYHG